MKTWSKAPAKTINIGNVVELEHLIVSVKGKRIDGGVMRFDTDHGVFKINPETEVDVYR